MKQYKVTITKFYDISVKAKNEDDAKKIAYNELWNAESTMTAHYLESGDAEVTVFDVTGTDDADDIINAQ